MNFKSGGNVEITTGRQTQVLPIDDKGCLKGRLLLGTLCRKA
jgi:hypothetical protein